ncbi:1-phosphatidylinositol 3-phosphate 5-kinase FAB1 [Phytophthora ramorum]|uniref:FYVE-type domain-containing protein n=1 Tax=Phytophthora ramorum TaxID=164328 RepID=H3GGL2_PHYRM|nr:1-phosphatidylinositol 3-phosphate 5-kinase FAB1 [Phytophthora ramorum]
MEFPLKTDFFPQVRLTADERRRYVATGEQSARALRSSMKTLDWKKTMEKDGVTYAQAHCIEGSSSVPNSPSASMAAGKTDDAIASACLMMSATAFAAGTISEALEALASPVTEDYRRAMHFLHGPRFVDGVCLHTIAGASPTADKLTNQGSSARSSNSQAFTTVKWAAFDDGKGLNTPGSSAGTDYCFLEHSGIHRGDANGSDPELFGFSIQESIARESEVPSLAGVGLARGHLHRTGILILPTDRSDVVQVTSILQMRVSQGSTLGGMSDGNGAASSAGKAGALALARRMRCRVSAVGRLDLLLERRRLNKLEHVSRADWVADDARKACAVCVKPFALRRRKHHCRHCGEVVCASCAPAREVDADAATIHVRICTACVVQSRTGPQALGGYEHVFVFHLRNAGFSPSSRSSTNSTGECATPTTTNAKHEVDTGPKSLSSGSSTFSISSDSQMSARLTRAGYAGGAIRLYDCEGDASSSGSSSSYSLSEFDAFDNLVATPLSNQDEADRHHTQRRRSSQRRGSGQPAFTSALSIGSNSSSTEPTADLLERIRGMKAVLSSLTTSHQQFNDTSSSSDKPNSFVEEEPVVDFTFRSEGVAQDARRRRARTSDADSGMDIDFINDDEHFTLLCPETLRQQWRTRTSSRVRQDAGEKSHLSASMSNMSFVSTLSNSTMLGDDMDAPEQRESQELEHEGIGAGENQAELLALRRQVEGLHRSLASATSQLDNIHSRRAQQPAPPSSDPVAARHQATYGLLVEELHEIMGLPRPGRER